MSDRALQAEYRDGILWLEHIERERKIRLFSDETLHCIITDRLREIEKITRNRGSNRPPTSQQH